MYVCMCARVCACMCVCVRTSVCARACVFFEVQSHHLLHVIPCIMGSGTGGNICTEKSVGRIGKDKVVCSK